MKTFFFRLSFCLLLTSFISIPRPLLSQSNTEPILEKMPADLESDWALSALPPHLRREATVYLLDPAKGYYISRKGANGFICFISRTEWEWGEFRSDMAVPMSYDAEGARTVFVVYQDVAAMRAAGKVSPAMVRDTVANRIRRGYYKAPARGGISYMLSPVMRAYRSNPSDKKINTISVPHYMFYAPYVTASEMGVTDSSEQSFILGNPGDYVLGAGKGPYGIIIVPVSHELKMKIVGDGAALLKRLVDYKAYFVVEDVGGSHHG